MSSLQIPAPFKVCIHLDTFGSNGNSSEWSLSSVFTGCSVTLPPVPTLSLSFSTCAACDNRSCAWTHVRWRVTKAIWPTQTNALLKSRWLKIAVHVFYSLNIYINKYIYIYISISHYVDSPKGWYNHPCAISLKECVGIWRQPKVFLHMLEYLNSPLQQRLGRKSWFTFKNVTCDLFSWEASNYPPRPNRIIWRSNSMHPLKLEWREPQSPKKSATPN